MLMSRQLFDRLTGNWVTQAALQTDATHWLHLRLITAPFVSNQDTALAELTLDTTLMTLQLFGGNESMKVYYDPLSGDRVGGPMPFLLGGADMTDGVFKSQLTPAVPVTFYGVALLNTAEDTLLATHVFDEPIIINKIAQGILVPLPDFRMPTSMAK